mgnify:CR=1 FL=1
MVSLYDLVIIGAGPAGLAASIYASRYGIKHIVLGINLGGTIALAHQVENYPGFTSISGTELSQKFLEHAKSLGAQIENREIIAIEKLNNNYLVKTNNDHQYQTRTIIIATGTKRRHLNIPGEGKYTGRGVSYCATCDAPFYKNKIAIVIGGANAACSGAIHLANFAQKVYLIYRRDKLRAEPAWVNQVRQNPKIEIIYDTNITEIDGDNNKVQKAKLDKAYQGKKELFTDGIFVEIGGVPVTGLAKNLGIKTDKDNYIITDNHMATNIPGIYCAGDTNAFQKYFQQVVTAVAEGAAASLGIYQYLKQDLPTPAAAAAKAAAR